MRSKNRSLYKAPKTLNRVRMNQPLSVGNSVIDRIVRYPVPHSVVAAVLISHQDRIISVHKTAQGRLQRLAVTFSAACATTLPPRAIAPITAVFFVPLPRLGGASLSLSFLRGLPPM